MAFAATMFQDVRSAERHPTELDGTLRDADRQPFDVLVQDLSAHGLYLSTPGAFVPGGVVTIGLPGLGVRAAMIVRADGDAYGCRFLERLTDEELARTLSAVATAPIPIPTQLAGYDTQPAGETAPQAEGYSPRVRLLVIAGIAMIGWALIVAARLLLG